MKFKKLSHQQSSLYLGECPKLLRPQLFELEQRLRLLQKQLGAPDLRLVLGQAQRLRHRLKDGLAATSVVALP